MSLENRNYIRWDTEGVERIPPNEAEDIQAVADMINEAQMGQFNRGRHSFGGTHARTQGLIKGELIVPGDLPKHLKQSMFAYGGKYPVAMRYSSEPGDPGLDDRIPQPRGFAMKIFDVEGDFMTDGVGIPTQDLELNSTPALELADAKTTREIIELRAKYANDKEGLYRELKSRKDAELQQARDQVPNMHLESSRYYSQSAFRFGDYVAKFALIPSSDTQKKLSDETVKPDQHDSQILSKWLKNFHTQHEAEYLLQFQLLESLDEQSVEYVGTPWDSEKYPWQTVAKLVVPQQDSFNYARKSYWEDSLRVDPWMGLKTLQPLGSANRLRKVVYPASSALRRKLNGRPEINAKSIDEIP
ncbi:MAG: hypothetical protein M1812_005621 [Candelaria pacifica]|nr:MAG: hypothetical protein M1812_005621 [Candelaria pacifica]